MSYIPVIAVQEKTLPEAWERAVISAGESGAPMRTEYDKEGDPASRDCTMIMTVLKPMSEPRIHRAFPGGLEDLEVYRQEVVDGVHDHWIDPAAGKWTYTYHKRLCDYEIEGEHIDQIDYMVTKLSKAPHTRRAQAITWNPKLDPPTDDPPCLQRLWCRLQEIDGTLSLHMNTHWRSRDGFKAAFMNIFALTDLQARIAERIGTAIGKKVTVGRYTDISDSFHIYGAYEAEFRQFCETVKVRSFQDKTWTGEFAQPYFDEAKKRLLHEKAKA